jgi:hypothetical protein
MHKQELALQKKEVAQLANDDTTKPPLNPFQLKPNNTGMPDNLKSGIENLSGISMDHVKVHYNSSQPAQLNAHAYAQGSDIHIAPGQEKHLPHEAWHVVQQAQGRVQATKQLKTDILLNDDAGLEHEADVMGEKALNSSMSDVSSKKIVNASTSTTQMKKVVQMINRSNNQTANVRMNYWAYSNLLADGDSIGTNAMTSCVTFAAYTADANHAIVAHFGGFEVKSVPEIIEEVREGITAIYTLMNSLSTDWTCIVFTGVDDGTSEVSEARISEISKGNPVIQRAAKASGIRLTRNAGAINVTWEAAISVSVGTGGKGGKNSGKSFTID